MLQELPPADKGYMYNWSADRDSRGGFKLDWAGETAICMQLCNHYKQSHIDAQEGPLKSPYLFIAGDSISHLGGWLEGAFMSSISAFSGMLRSLHNSAGALHGENGLSDAGKMLHQTPAP